MCGIAGIISSQGNINVTDIRPMTDAIQHRGPDGEGIFINNDGNVGLGHRRLSIIDLSNAGAQPMASKDNRYNIIFNGEIYNYIELKEIQLKKGYQFSSHSDTEVLLSLFIEKGEECLNDLDGMFAFAIWDDVKKKLFCARDRFGEKPFYYHYVAGKHFVFASEIKALKAYGIKMEFHPHRLGWYLNDKYALSNPQFQDETFFKNISKLEAGFCLAIDKNITLTKKKYWDIDIDKIDLSISLEQAKEQFSYLFKQSVKRRLRSDVSIGTSLSGGLDSSSVVCIIADILNGSGASQKTFSARFANYSLDEGGFIEEVIKGKQLEAFYTWPGGNDLLSEFEKFIYHQEEPVGSANQFSQWQVMKLAKNENVVVLLDGQGADEIVTGYSHYFDIYFKELYHNYPHLFQEELKAYVQNINPQYQFEFHNRSKNLADKTKELVYPFYSRMIKPMMPVRKNHFGLLDPDYGSEANKFGGYKYFNYSEGLNSGLYHDAKNGKLEVLLRYGDKNSMAHGREVRLPFLSHPLTEFIFSLPPWFKIHNGWSKFILRESMKEILPEKITWRKDKIGYQTPQERWLVKDKFQEMINESITLLENKGIVNRLRKKEEIQNREWQLLNIATLINTYHL